MKHEMIARRTAARDRLSPYVRARVLPALGIAGSAFTLEVAPEGTRSIVLFLAAGGRHFVVKCLDDVLRATRTVLTIRHMLRRGAPVPRLLYVDLSPMTLLRYGVVVMVEEAVAGPSFRDVKATDERLRSAAAALAQLHSITRKRWGPPLPGLGRRGGYFDLLHGRLERRIADLATRSPAYAPALGPEARAWFQAQREAVESIRRFSLCHLRVTATNVLFQPDGSATLIDVVTARYGHHAVDLERALYRWCGRDPRRQEVFLTAYFERFQVVDRERWQRDRPYFQASFHLTQAYRAAKQYRHFRPLLRLGKSRRRRRDLARHLRAYLEVLRAAGDAPARPWLAAARQAVRVAMADARADEHAARDSRQSEC